MLLVYNAGAIVTSAPVNYKDQPTRGDYCSRAIFRGMREHVACKRRVGLFVSVEFENE